MQSITSDIPREIEELLINIKYISALPPGHKYDLGSQHYISASLIPSKIYRTAANWIYTNEDKVGARDLF
jgi:hypothetical protein